MMGEKGRKTLISVVCFLVMFVIAAQPKLNGSDNPNQQTILGEGWNITGERGIRSSEVSRIRGTEELIYITYSQEPYIDVYDLSGSFLYSILLPDSQNGMVLIDCRDGMLIAAAKGRNADGHDVFLFRGQELVESMDHTQASARGVKPSSYDQESDYLLTLTHVTRADGTVLFELPPEIAENMPKFLLTEGQEQVAKVLVVVLFAVFWLTVVGGCLRQILKKK